jgi:hypothetical protein
VQILDIDLDFFVHGVQHHVPSDGERLDDQHYPPWSLDEAMSFLRDRCGLTDRLPGFVVEHHGQLFPLWRDAIAAGDFPGSFHVTHVDAHADLGLGDAGYKQIMCDLMWRDPSERTQPHTGGMTGLGDGNYLAFAVAARWTEDLVYVHNDEGGHDLLVPHMRDYDHEASYLQMKALTDQEFDQMLWGTSKPEPQVADPPVPFRMVHWADFTADCPYDVVCLARSPGYTPAACDLIFDAIIDEFMDILPFRT